MVGTSVNGLLGVDAELERSVLAAQNETPDDHSVRVLAPRQATWDCPGPASQPTSRNREWRSIRNTGEPGICSA